MHWSLVPFQIKGVVSHFIADFTRDLCVEFVKEWVVKSSKILFTFADIPHNTSWFYVGNLPNDRDSISKIWKNLTWLIKAMMSSGKNGNLRKKLKFLFRATSMTLKMTAPNIFSNLNFKMLVESLGDM